jgi:hypothetical protein
MINLYVPITLINNCYCTHFLLLFFDPATHIYMCVCVCIYIY